MANYAVSAAQVGAYAKQLVANTVDTVTFANEVPVEVWADGTAAVYFTVDGTAPTVGGAATYEIPAGGAAVRRVPVPSSEHGGTVVKLISAGTPTYSVSGTS